MNWKTKSFILFSFIFVTSVSFAQYKYDIGVRTSSYDMERFQLEQRFHFDSPWSLVATLLTGSASDGSFSQTPTYGDSLFDVNTNIYNASNFGLKIGVQRKLGFFATDVFYARASIGIGMEKRRTSSYLSTYSNPAGGENIPGSNPYITQISSAEEIHELSLFGSQLALSFGMDVPISKRFSINAELGMAGIYSHSLTSALSTINLFGSVSGGLRYQFGVRK